MTAWDTVWQPFLLSLVASLLTVAILAAREHLLIRRAADKYLGEWDQYIIGAARRPERDPENCRVEIRRPDRWRSNVLHLRATHSPPEHPTLVRIWEGQVVIDRAVHNRGVITWAYTSPPEEREFGVYDLYMHDNGELLVTPALPPLQGEYLRFVLRRTAAPLSGVRR